MQFTKEEFKAFRADFQNATRDLCEKYKLKMEIADIFYGSVDFEMKVIFEKSEGLPVERIKFESECEYYGFSPDDYLRIVQFNGMEYEFVGFQRGAKKYKCIIREIESGEESRITEADMHKLFERFPKREIMDIQQDIEEVASMEPVADEKMTKSVTEGKAAEPVTKAQTVDLSKKSDYSLDNIEGINFLTKEEHAFLKIKMGKSKRSERDWTQIKEVLYGKHMLTFVPEKGNPFVGCVDEMAIEKEFVSLYTDKELLGQHLEDLYSLGIVGQIVRVVGEVFEEFIERADKNNLNIMIYYDSNPDRYLAYYSETRSLKAICMVKQ